jgi:hypothetical protein
MQAVGQQAAGKGGKPGCQPELPDGTGDPSDRGESAAATAAAAGPQEKHWCSPGGETSARPQRKECQRSPGRPSSLGGGPAPFQREDIEGYQRSSDRRGRSGGGSAADRQRKAVPVSRRIHPLWGNAGAGAEQLLG